jgi:putative membrane protein
MNQTNRPLFTWAARLLVAFVALQHLAFLVLEMFLWTEPVGMRVFGTTESFARESAALAANQGLYNGFLVAGLIWGLSRGDDGRHLLIFFLLCVIVAGAFGAWTVKPTIFLVQGVPGFVALILVLLSGDRERRSL